MQRYLIYRHTSVDNVAIVSIVQSQNELNGKSPHDWIWYHVTFEPRAEASQCFAHKFKYQAYVSSIRTLVLEIVDQMTDVSVSWMGLVHGPELDQDFLLENRLVTSIAFRA